MENINTVLFSDVHLGSPTSRAYELLNALKEHRFKKLVIVGDMFDDLNFEYLKSTHWELLEHIGKLSRRGVEVVWIEGNHDAKFYQFMSHLIGIPVYKEYSWQVNKKEFIALHGHQFDNFESKNIILGKIMAVAYTKFKRILFSSNAFENLLFKISDRWLRLTEQVAEKALDYAESKHRDVIICGHTHFVHNKTNSGTEYYNLGCWNNKHSHLMFIQEDGSTHLKQIT